MRIGIVSDSHGNLHDLEQALLAMGHVDILFHLGDYVEDGEYLKTLTDTPVYLAKGNMDRYAKAGKDEILLVIEGVAILACHGHTYGVKSDLYRLAMRGRERNARIVLFGHTHHPYSSDDGEIMLFNPGSVGAPRLSGEKTYGIISINGDQIDGEIISLKK
ncbi:metallophosphoesterase [Eubacteriaceae bacterium ES3]|nr:metallophosphoesterase [Eubacteriaceae bacterium ES3]